MIAMPDAATPPTKLTEEVLRSAIPPPLSEYMAVPLSPAIFSSTTVFPCIESDADPPARCIPPPEDAA
jgi:hypothetical protein